MALSPTGDRFLTASLDSCVRLWDLSSPQCVGIMKSNEGHHVVAIDPEAFVFATLSTGNIGRFYDLKKLEAGPFLTFTIPDDPVTWSSLEFSPDGKFLLASTHQGFVFLLDAITGKVVRPFSFISFAYLRLRLAPQIQRRESDQVSPGSYFHP